jgi:FixJ family two-component response regulator
MLEKTILVVTPLRDFAEAVSVALAEQGYGTRVSANRYDAVRQADEDAFDCVLIDWDAGEAFGRSLMTDLADHGHGIPKIILSSPENLRSAVLAFRSGASDLLEKPLSAGDLRPAIDEAIVRARRSTQLARDIADARRALAGLSEREQQVVSGIVAGLTSREIAAAVGISARTVETSRTRLLGKLNIPNTAALVRLAVLAGLTSLAREPVRA